MAFCLRFINNCSQKPKISGNLIASELHEAEIKIIKIIQKKAFNDEMHQISNGNEVKRSSKIRDLHPFMDKNGILRVGGRLKNAAMTISTKYYYQLEMT